MNTSLLAGLGAGTGLVLATGIGLSVLYPPETGPAVAPPAAQTEDTAPPEPERAPLATLDTAEDEGADDAPALLDPESEAEITEDAQETAETAPDTDTPDVRDASEFDPAGMTESVSPSDETAPDTDASDAPAIDSAEVAESAPPAEEPAPDTDATDTPDLAAMEEAAPSVSETAADSPGTPADPDPAGAISTPAPQPDVPQSDMADDARDLAEDARPAVPPSEAQVALSGLPRAIRPGLRSDGGLPQITPPAQAAPDSAEPEAGNGTGAADDPAEVTQQDSPTMPGVRSVGLPQLGLRDGLPSTESDVPPVTDSQRSAVERNSLYEGISGSGPRMALVLGDPGLPMPIRRDLAAMDLPMTIALNPLDPSASDAAEVYRAGGKEVLIMASSLPDGATASDLDVNFNAYFSALPQAVGVLDLPEGGFTRNARLLDNVLPLLAQDGHGLVSFGGGLTAVDRAAQAADVAQTEVFRVLDAGGESPFTIRRYLDRAVFQASQMGQVVVFGDASNEDTMEALDMWLTDGLADQVTLVPISGILLADD
ncbi:MAG: divergent polysaccharide deacetylase family protein [Rhodobacteraceae bacterium]|nr:divergent polysaccharide deacetylase family protein [Paracoccaceae bacterium]